MDVVENNDAVPDQLLNLESLTSDLLKFISVLNEREQIVIKYFYGLGGETPHTLDDVGERMKITRERARQIKEQALGKLRRIGGKQLLSHL
jgi:RNA polymerase primary sigma factor